MKIVSFFQSLFQIQTMASGGCLDLTEENKTCTPCSSKGNSVKFQHFCLDCEAYYCEVCFELHLRVPNLAKHIVLKQKDVGLWSSLQYKCTSHENKFEFFCKTHDKLCCHSCLAFQHRSCDEVGVISEYAKDEHINQRRKLLSSRIEVDLKKVHQYDEGFNRKLALNLSSKDTFQQTLRVFRNRVNSLFDQIETTLSMSMEAKFANNSEYIDKTKRELKKIEKELGVYQRRLDTSSKDLEVLRFICLIEGNVSVESLEDKLTKMDITTYNENFKLDVSDKVDSLFKAFSSLVCVTDEQVTQSAMSCEEPSDSREWCQSKQYAATKCNDDKNIKINFTDKNDNDRLFEISSEAFEQELTEGVYSFANPTHKLEEACLTVIMDMKEETEMATGQDRTPELEFDKEEINSQQYASSQTVSENDVEYDTVLKGDIDIIDRKSEQKQTKALELHSIIKEDEPISESGKLGPSLMEDILCEVYDMDDDGILTEENQESNVHGRLLEAEDKADDKNNIQVFVKRTHQKTVLLDVNLSDTIETVKKKYVNKSGDQQLGNFDLRYGLKTLIDKEQVQDYGLPNFTTVELHERFNFEKSADSK